MISLEPSNPQSVVAKEGCIVPCTQYHHLTSTLLPKHPQSSIDTSHPCMRPSLDDRLDVSRR